MLKTIMVTKEHIKNGTRGSTTACPIAQALLGIGCKSVAITSGWIEYKIYGQYYGIVTPEICDDFIIVFDEGEVVPGPIEFKIRFPQKELGNNENKTVKIKHEPEQLRNLLGQSC